MKSNFILYILISFGTHGRWTFFHQEIKSAPAYTKPTEFSRMLNFDS
jgi:hypothetical protein